MIPPAHPSRRAFTLIELLVVIAILGVLMTLLFPAVQGAMEAAKKTQAKNDVTQIVTAIQAYVTEYGRMPGNASGDVSQANNETLWAILAPNAGDANSDNPRGITFLEVPQAKSGKNGRVDNKGTFKDSWGQDYFISLDGDYDNKVEGPGGGNVTKTVIAWSTGTPKGGSPNADSKKFVKSWE